MIDVKIVNASGRSTEGKLDHLTGLVYQTVESGVVQVDTVHNLVAGQNLLHIKDYPQEEGPLNFDQFTN